MERIEKIKTSIECRSQVIAIIRHFLDVHNFDDNKLILEDYFDLRIDLNRFINELEILNHRDNSKLED